MCQRRLLAVFAHPDDEAFGVGGTLARYASEGVDVWLVTASRGEAGGISDPTLATRANLPDVREDELRCACRAYGIRPPTFLDYVDGQLTIAHQGQAVGKLVRLIRSIEPQVVITFGPDGAYGLYDHIAVHRWTTIAVELAADAGCFPDPEKTQCPTHHVAKLYYVALPEAQVKAMAEHGTAAVMMDGVPFPFVSRSPDEITTVIDVSDYATLKWQGIRCHATQVAPDSPMLEDRNAAIAQPWFTAESYVLAASKPGVGVGIERDLFAGLV